MRTRSVVVVVLVLSALCPAGSSTAPRRAAWTQLGHDAGSSYHQPDETLIGHTTVGSLTRAWRVDVVPPRFEGIGGGPAIAGGLVYVAGFGRIEDRRARSRLYALDLDTGSLRWSARLPGFVRWTPTVEAGVVVVTLDAPDLPMGLLGVDARTGERRWFRPLDCRGCSPSRGETWPAVASDGVVLGALGGVFPGGGAGYDPYGKLWALDVHDGTVLWSRPMRSPDQPIVLDGTVMVGEDSLEMNADESILALDLLTGEQRWRRTRRIAWEVGLFGAGTQVFARTGSRLLALDTADGSVTWARDVGQCCGPSSVGVRRVFVVGRMPEGEGLIALDRTDGSFLWSRSIGSFGYSMFTSPAIVANHLLYVAGRYEYGDRELARIRPTNATFAVRAGGGRTVARLPRGLAGVEYFNLVIADGYLVKTEWTVVVAYTVP